MNVIPVILAGGGGTRFWPLSRQNKPKQLLNLSGNDIMINDTVARYQTVIPLQNTMIITNQVQAELLKKILLEEVPRENILKEPMARNTAACILYAALVIQKKFQDAVMVVLPSDHYLTEIEEFRNVLRKAGEAAEATGKLVTIGIHPTFPATGYGYINFEKKANPDLPLNTFEVNEFVKNPHLKKPGNTLVPGIISGTAGCLPGKHR